MDGGMTCPHPPTRPLVVKTTKCATRQPKATYAGLRFIRWLADSTMNGVVRIADNATPINGKLTHAVRVWRQAGMAEATPQRACTVSRIRQQSLGGLVVTGHQLARWRAMADQWTLDLDGCDRRVMACRPAVDAPHGNLTGGRMGLALDPAEHQA